MRKMRKLLTALLAGVMLLGLTACGGDAGQTTSGGTVAVTEWQAVGDIGGLDLIVDETDGDYTVQIPQFKDADGNDSLTDMNARLQQLATDYEVSKTVDGMNWEVVPLVVETPNYLSVVLYQGEWPNYGTDGTATSYVYDKVTKSEVSEELAWSLAGTTDDGVADAIKAYCESVMNQSGGDFRWLSFNTNGYYMDSDGKMALILSVSIKDKSVEDAESWDYLLVFKGGQIIGNLVNMIG